MIVLLVNTTFFNQKGMIVCATSITYETDPRTATLMQHESVKHNNQKVPDFGYLPSRIDIVELANTNT